MPPRRPPLRPIHPNAGLRVAYRKRLAALVGEMLASYRYWLMAKLHANPPAIAQDASPSKALEAELKKLGKRWQKQFDEMAYKLAGYFALKTSKRSDAALKKILKDAGFSVEFKFTAAHRDVMAATIAENVSLIKSIPEQFHFKVEGLVMRSFTTGRDLHQLTKDLQKQFKVPRQRAELIARDQNNKATAAFTRVRYLDMGIKEAIWLHSGGGKEPRPTHVKNSGKKYDIEKGWYDPAVGEHIHPGQLINCRCVARPVVQGFS